MLTSVTYVLRVLGRPYLKELPISAVCSAVLYCVSAHRDHRNYQLENIPFLRCSNRKLKQPNVCGYIYIYVYITTDRTGNEKLSMEDDKQSWKLNHQLNS